MKKFINTLLVMCVMVLALAFGVEKDVYATGEANPRLLVENYWLSDDEITPGEEFTLTMRIRNTSLFYDTYSAVVTVTDNTGNKIPMIHPSYGLSNQAYIEKVYARNSWDVTLHLKAESNIDIAAVPMLVTITYNDNYYIEKQKNESMISLPVKLNGALNVVSSTVTESVMKGAKARLFVKYENTGINKLNNVQLNVNYGEDSTISKNLYSIEGGKNATAEVYIDCKEEGKLPVTLSFTYENEDGISFETDKLEYITNVTNEEAVADDTEVVVINGGVNIFTFILLGAIAITIIIILILLRERRRK